MGFNIGVSGEMNDSFATTRDVGVGETPYNSYSPRIDLVYRLADMLNQSGAQQNLLFGGEGYGGSFESAAQRAARERGVYENAKPYGGWGGYGSTNPVQSQGSGYMPQTSTTGMPPQPTGTIYTRPPSGSPPMPGGTVQPAPPRIQQGSGVMPNVGPKSSQGGMTVGVPAGARPISAPVGTGAYDKVIGGGPAPQAQAPLFEYRNNQPFFKGRPMTKADEQDPDYLALARGEAAAYGGRTPAYLDDNVTGLKNRLIAKGMNPDTDFDVQGVQNAISAGVSPDTIQKHYEQVLSQAGPNAFSVGHGQLGVLDVEKLKNGTMTRAALANAAGGGWAPTAGTAPSGSSSKMAPTQSMDVDPYAGVSAQDTPYSAFSKGTPVGTTQNVVGGTSDGALVWDPIQQAWVPFAGLGNTGGDTNSGGIPGDYDGPGGGGGPGSYGGSGDAGISTTTGGSGTFGGGGGGGSLNSGGAGAGPVISAFDPVEDTDGKTVQYPVWGKQWVWQEQEIGADGKPVWITGEDGKKMPKLVTKSRDTWNFEQGQNDQQTADAWSTSAPWRPEAPIGGLYGSFSDMAGGRLTDYENAIGQGWQGYAANPMNGADSWLAQSLGEYTRGPGKGIDEAFGAYNKMINSEGYSPAERGAIEGSTVSGVTQGYQRNMDEIRRQAARTGNANSAYAAMSSQAGNYGAQLGEANRQNQVKFADEAQRRKEAGASGMTNVASLANTKAQFGLNAQQNLANELARRKEAGYRGMGDYAAFGRGLQQQGTAGLQTMAQQQQQNTQNLYQTIAGILGQGAGSAATGSGKGFGWGVGVKGGS